MTASNPMFPPCPHGLAAYKCIECLHADNRRLRAALKAIEDCEEWTALAMAEIATNALRPADETSESTK